MTREQILSLGPALAGFLDRFADCFARSEPRSHLADYVRGQLSDLPRKSVQPVALAAGLCPRTLQEFLNADQWDHELLRERIQRIVATEHADADAIGIIDDSGHPKKGNHTACVARQYCGNSGKIDNCVNTVHLSYASYDLRFRTMVDSTPYLPEKGWDDPERRRVAGIPDQVIYRPKYQIALEQLDRALGNGLTFRWIVADEWYGQKPVFLAALQQRRLRFVVEIPCNFSGWFRQPSSWRQPLSVDNLCRLFPEMTQQPWLRVHVKTTEKGPVVWEIKVAPLWWRQGRTVVGPHWLLHARNLLDPTEEKYFLSNAAPGAPLEALVHVAFGRWPIERCLEDEKSELGLSHFEVRKYQALQRHLLITQLSHLFLARQTKRLRGEKSGDHPVPGSHRSRRPRRHVAVFA